jgi:hypothetical protein
MRILLDTAGNLYRVEPAVTEPGGGEGVLMESHKIWASIASAERLSASRAL